MSSPIANISRERCYIIAEIGQNHQGDPEIARQLVREAARAGVDAVKSQKRDVHALLTPAEFERRYDSPHRFGATYGEHRLALELSPEVHRELRSYAERLGLEYFCSPWDLPSLRVLRDVVGVRLLKVPSACVTHHALLEEIADSGIPVILSTGMSTIGEVRAAVEILRGSELYVLQCTSSYPSSFEDVHLQVMPTYRDEFGCTVGLSGHHRGVAIDIAAVALGARIIERHFTLDRTWKGSDHAASLEPPGLHRLVRDIRAVEQALGSPVKQVVPAEEPVRVKLRGARLRRVA